MSVVVITPPEPIVTLAEAKAHLRVDDGDDDAMIAAFVAAATAHIDGPDGWVGRCFGPQTLELRSEGFPACGSVVIPLPCPPLIEVLSVTYDDSAGAPVVINPGAYGIVGMRGLYPKPGHAWPAARWRPDAVRVLYRAGYDGSEGIGPVPAPVKAAILLMVGDLNAHRETVAEGTRAPIDMSTTVERLLTPYRLYA